MTPYFSKDGCVIYLGDCRDVLASLTAGQIVTSPPFNCGMEYELTSWASLSEFDEFTRQWVNASCACLRPGGWFCCEVQDMHVSPEHPHAAAGQKEQSCMATHAKIILELIQAGMLFKASAVWDRGRWTRGNASLLNCAPGSEAILVQHSNLLFARKHGGRPGAYDFPELTGKEKATWCRSIWSHVGPESVPGHPCPLPRQMAGGFIRCWSLPPDVIVDPFCGSGNVLLAARELGRQAVGIEKEERYAELAANRLSQGLLSFE